MIYEIKFTITPNVALGVLSKAWQDEFREATSNALQTEGMIDVESSYEELPAKLKNLTGHLPNTHSVDFEVKMEFSF